MMTAAGGGEEEGTRGGKRSRVAGITMTMAAASKNSNDGLRRPPTPPRGVGGAGDGRRTGPG